MSQPYLALEAELHDAFWEAEDDGSEVRLMAAFLRKFPGPALEMGAGSGRLLLPLLQLGFAVEGLELSQDMLALGSIRARRLGISPTMHEGDMAGWTGGRKFSALLAPAFTLQLAADPAAVLRHWHGLLENGGGLYLTVFIPYAELLGDLPENAWYEDHRVTLADGRIGLLETRHRLDRARRVLEREHCYSLSGDPPVTHRSRQTLCWFEHEEVVVLLNACGFRVDRFFVDFAPETSVDIPDEGDSNGILTYHATRLA